MKIMKKLLTLMGTLALTVPAQASCYGFDTKGGTVTLDAATQINSTDRVCINQGTVNLNAGATIICGGNQNSTCNYIGVDRDNQAATLNVNGGTFWCSRAKGSGFLKISANANNQTATLTINSGSVTVDEQLWTCTYWNNNNGSTGRGIINVNGGALTVGTLFVGADSNNSGSTEICLVNGTLTARSIDFRAYNKQIFQLKGGTLKAAAANVFYADRAYADTEGRTIDVVDKTTSTFDNNAFNQTIPPMTGTGTLRLMGAGAFSFAESELTYNLEFAGGALALGTANASAPLLTVGGALTIKAPTPVSLSLPAGATGRYPIIAGCGNTSAYAVAHLLRSPLGTFVLDNGTIYLDVGASPSDGLIYSATAGGDDTPGAGSYLYAAFTPTAGAFTVNGQALTLAGHGIVIGTQSEETQTVTPSLSFANANAGIYTAENSTLVLNGGFTANAPSKYGPGTLVLGSAAITGALTVVEGTVDLGGHTITGSILPSTDNGRGRTITYKNGTLNESGAFNIGTGSDVHLGEGFNLNLTNAGGGRLTVGYYNPWPRNESTLYLDPGCGTVTLRGNASNTCNFITPDNATTGRVVVAGGVLHALRGPDLPPYGCLRIATGTNPMSTGFLKVVGGEVVVDWDLSLATVYNDLKGGAGTAEVDLESGTMRIAYFYLGGSTSAVGKGTIRLTGGDLYVKMFKCWGCCTQTLVCDGARIHAVQDSYAGVPFMTAFASADSYPKSYTIGAGGLLIDTAGYKVSCDIPFTGVGGITVTGTGGILTNTVTAAYTGGLKVEEGVRVVYPAGFAPKAVSLAPNAVLQVTPTETTPATLGTLTLAEGAKLVVDVSSVGSAQARVRAEGFVVPAGKSVLDFVEVKDDASDTPRYTKTLENEGKTIVLTFADLAEPFFATWSGEGEDPTNVRDPANWDCLNALEEPLENVIPTAHTTVYLSGATMFSVPAAQALAVKAFTTVGPVTLTGDCDWRGLGDLTVQEGMTVDLRGHKLYVGHVVGGGKITDTSAEYQPLDYIESTGAEYINTGYRHTAATRIECVVNAGSVQPGVWAGIFGARDTTFQTSAFVFFAKSGKTGNASVYNRTGEETFTDTIPYDTKIALTCSGCQASWYRLDDPSKTGGITTGGTPDAGANDLFIFNLNTGTGAGSVKTDGSWCRMKLYSFKIYEGETLIRDFVPRRRVSDGAAGLWDLQSQTFYPNNGTGRFYGVANVAESTPAAWGELHIDVPEGGTYAWSSVIVNGALKVVKDGAGTLTMQRSDHGYCGGTEVAAGKMCGTSWGGCCGAYGTSVTIDEGATFDINGVAIGVYEFVLNGGTLANTVKDVGSGLAQISRIRLTADSSIYAPYRMGLIGPSYSVTTLDLGGHTLTVDAPLDFFLCNTDLTPGTFKMVDGFMYNNRTSVRGALADFDIDCVLTLEVDVDAHDFIYRWVREPRSGTKNAYGTHKVRVFGTFTPLSPKFHNVEMQNGSILNLAEQTDVWSATSANVDNGTHKTSFATNALVTVDMGARKISSEWTYVVEWGTAGVPENLDTLTFKVSGRYAQGALAKADERGVKISRIGFILYVR